MHSGICTPELGESHSGSLVRTQNCLFKCLCRSQGSSEVCDFTPEEFIQSTAFRYISDAITKEEALALLKSREATKKERLETVLQQGYPAYTTSVGCMLQSFKSRTWLS